MAEQTNFGKSALITGIVLGVLAGGFGAYMMTGSKVERPQTRLNAGEAKSVAQLAALADEVVAARQKNHTLADVAPEGATVNGKPRFAPIFFSPELWQIAVDSEQKNTIIDIYDPTAQSIHKDVPNHWFISNGIADALGRADGLALDSDSDGFSNGEEFAAETHPGDPKSLPALVQVGKTPKLEVVSITQASAVIAVDSTLAFEANPTTAGIKIFAKPGDSKPIHRVASVKAGESFGLKSGDNRFTVLGFEKAQFSDSVGNNSEEAVIRVRDNVTAGAEKEFIIRSGSPTKPGSKDYATPNAKAKVINDTTAELRVTAGTAAGNTVKVQLKGTFTVPGTDITCMLESVDASGSVNVLPNGAESPVQVPAAAK